MYFTFRTRIYQHLEVEDINQRFPLTADLFSIETAPFTEAMKRSSFVCVLCPRNIFSDIMEFVFNGPVIHTKWVAFSMGLEVNGVLKICRKNCLENYKFRSKRNSFVWFMFGDDEDMELKPNEWRLLKSLVLHKKVFK